MKKIYALIVAAGRGSRFGSTLPKQYCTISKKMVLTHTVGAFACHPDISGVLVLIHPDDQDLYDEAVESFDILPCVFGGANRQESVLNGLKALEGLAPDLVLIHDAARPFVPKEVIDRVIENIKPSQGVIPAQPVADTLKKDQDGLCLETIDRNHLWRAQTPQGFLFEDIYPAHLMAAGQELTDDAAVLEAAGKQVAIVMGHEDNFKLTTPEDMVKAQRIVNMYAEFRTGTGFDVHKFADGDFVTLCGVEIPHTHALSGHSDADVAMHALTDAILGAIAEGDIGTHFPPTDMQWKGARSDIFLKKACDLVAEKQGKLVNIDLTIICERPKVGPHREAMRKRLAEICEIDLDRVSVKGTTTEKLGFTGRGEGIAAQAAVSIKL